MNYTHKISVVIPVKNEEKFLETTVRTLLNQDYPRDRLEILIVVGESDDSTMEIAQSLATEEKCVTVLENDLGFSSVGRNIGAKKATGDIITFVDGHTHIDNDELFKSIVELMDSKDVSVLSRPQYLDTPHNTFFQRAVSLARKSTIGHGLDSTIYTREDKYVNPASSGASYKREVFENVGHFDERFDACEDVDFNARVAQAGYKSFTSMKLAVFYYPRATLSGLFNQMKRYGVGRFRLFCKHPGSLSLGTLAPLFITIGLPLLGLLSAFSTVLLYPFLAILVLYLSALSAFSIMISIKNGPGYLFILPLIYLTIHLGLGWGFFIESIRLIFGRGVKFR